MNIFKRITVRMLKVNRTRTLVTIVGVILSTAMICAITTLISSLRGYLIDLKVYDGGDWYGRGVMRCENIDTLKDDKRVCNVVSAQIIGYALCGSQNEDKPYVCVIGTDDAFNSSMPVHLTEGRMPKTSSEIILPEHLENNGRLYYGIGDKLSLRLGSRVDAEGNELFQFRMFSYEEECLNVEQTREYIVVGKYERPGFEHFTAPGYTAITVKDNTANMQDMYEVFYKTKPAGKVYDVRSDYLDMMFEDNINSSLLAYSGVIGYANIAAMMLQIIVILIAIVLFGSISLIYNAFSISANERSRQFGLLASIGATKKQIRKSVMFESSVISAIGIPIGILCGILGIFVTLLFVRSGIAHIFAGGMSKVPFRFSVSWFSVALAAIIAFATVRISASWPAKRISKISPIEAIRQTREIKVSSKDVRTSKLTYKLFGVEGMIARKHYKRNRRKYRSTVIALSVSIILFVTANMFCGYLLSSADMVMMDQGYDISYGESVFDSASPSEDGILSARARAEQLSGAEGVTDWKYYFTQNEDLYKADSSSFAVDEYNKLSGGTGALEPVSGECQLTLVKMYLDDEDYRSLVSASGLDAAEYLQSDDPLPIVWDTVTVESFSDGNRTWREMNALEQDANSIIYYPPKAIEGCTFSEITIDQMGNEIAVYTGDDDGDEIIIPVEEAFAVKKEIALGARASAEWMKSFPNSKRSYFAVTLIYPMRMLENAELDRTEVEKLWLTSIYYSTDHAASYEAMEKMLARSMDESYSLHDYTEMISGERSMIQVISVFVYGFIALMALISAANVFNTISTNINLRRREFSMLRSIGMNARGLNRMMNYECVLYGVRSIIVGIPVSVLLSYLIYRSMDDTFDLPFVLPWKALVIAAGSVFAIVFITMLYSMHKIKQDDPVETLKNDNI